jgi:hypothetical protein
MGCVWLVTNTECSYEVVQYFCVTGWEYFECQVLSVSSDALCWLLEMSRLLCTLIPIFCTSGHPGESPPLSAARRPEEQLSVRSPHQGSWGECSQSYNKCLGQRYRSGGRTTEWQAGAQGRHRLGHTVVKQPNPPCSKAFLEKRIFSYLVKKKLCFWTSRKFCYHFKWRPLLQMNDLH